MISHCSEASASPICHRPERSRSRTSPSGSRKAATVAIDHLDLRADPGEFMVLLGPSGCGKTTTLRTLAGLEAPTEGRIMLGNTLQSSTPTLASICAPHLRKIGMVFQSYALWPHMTVGENIAFPLKCRRYPRPDRTRRVREMAARVDCGELLDRYPGQLSGGQQQRVALARGLVGDPEVVLFDEPLSNLDPKLRLMVRAHLFEVHRELGFTALFVTHDQGEALALGEPLGSDESRTHRAIRYSLTLSLNTIDRVRRRLHGNVQSSGVGTYRLGLLVSCQPGRGSRRKRCPDRSIGPQRYRVGSGRTTSRFTRLARS